MGDYQLSIIVPTLNASPYIKKCIGMLQSQLGDKMEIIVVDDASSDNTVDLVASMGVNYYQLKTKSGPSIARNLGASKAGGEYLFFIDSDIVIHPGGLLRVCTFFDTNPDVSAVFGSYDTAPSERGVVTQYKNLLHHFVHQKGKREASTFWSGCGAIRRTVFRELNGFNEIEYPMCIEDIELGYRLRQAKHKIELDRDLLCTHLKRWTLMKTLKTDVLCRAIPWTRLNFSRNVSPDDLNIKRSQKISVLLIALSFVFLLLSFFNPWCLIEVVLLLLLIILLNFPLFIFFGKQRGLIFVIACIPLHLFYFFYSGLSFLYVWLAIKVGVTIFDWNEVSKN